ncbi:MAG: response regulator transcription factor, partial [Chloroflexia bacterium]|nr:response regulator transcription factor [Chloroflexia bacterium]
SLSTHLWRLRQKLGVGPAGREYIVNVRGRGYKFVS